VALVALVFVRFARELIVVLVHVAIRTFLKARDLEDRVLALGRVAFVALDFGVSFDERIVRLRVRLHVK